MATGADAGAEQEEDATELVFGKGNAYSKCSSLVHEALSVRAVFDTADALLISEVKMLLEHRKAQYESQEEDHELSEVRGHCTTTLSPVSRLLCLCVCRCSQRRWTIARPSASTAAKKPSLQ